MSNPKHHLRLLWLEDNEDDVFFMTTALKRGCLPMDVQHAWNGCEGLNLLAQDHSKKPHAVLTDIRMPLMDGISFISAVRQTPELQGLPVFILSTSGLTRDVQTALDAGGNGYFVKPTALDEWEARIRDIYHQLLERVRLQPNAGPSPVGFTAPLDCCPR